MRILKKNRGSLPHLNSYKRKTWLLYRSFGVRENWITYAGRRQLPWSGHKVPRPRSYHAANGVPEPDSSGANSVACPLHGWAFLTPPKTCAILIA